MVLARNSGKGRLNQLGPALDEKRMVVPSSAILDFRRVAADLQSRVSHVLLVAIPACFGLVRREDESHCTLNPVGSHSPERIDEKRSGVAHSDIHRQIHALLSQ